MLKSESRSEAFASKVWISKSFTAPNIALIASDVSTMKVMFFCVTPISRGMKLALLGWDFTYIVAIEHVSAKKEKKAY